MSDVDELYRQIGFLFDSDDGSLPEVRLTGLTVDQMPLVYARLRAIASRINDGAYFWDRRGDREASVDSVPNAAALVVSGDAEAFHLVLQDPRVGAVALPPLGVFVSPEEIALDYRMGPEWGPAEVSALVDLLCDLKRLAPGSRVELEENALAEIRARFAAAVAQHCERRPPAAMLARFEVRDVFELSGRGRVVSGTILHGAIRVGRRMRAEHAPDLAFTIAGVEFVDNIATHEAWIALVSTDAPPLAALKEQLAAGSVLVDCES